MKRIGVFGGTFDPPHIGHLRLAEAALTQLNLDEVLWLPAKQNPLKAGKPLSPQEDRLKMLELILSARTDMSVSNIDLTRKGPSYAVDSLSELTFAFPGDYWFILGADALRRFPQWKNPARLLKMCRLAVAIRPPMTEMDAILKLPEEFREKVDVVRMAETPTSSTEIRDRIATGMSTLDWLPQPVLQYIADRGLYRS